MLQRVLAVVVVVVLGSSFTPVITTASQAASPRAIQSAVDISWIPDVEKTGTKFKDKNSQAIDPIKLMAKAGIEYGRIRVFTSNQLGHGTIARALKLAKRLKAEKRKVILDFHLSDVWADPANQSIPSAWSKTDSELLKQQMQDYLESSLLKFRRVGVVPDVVQVGNEIGNGFLWPLAQINSNDSLQWEAFVELYNAGVAAVRTASPNSKILLHLHQPNAGWLEWWWNNAQSAGIVDVDFVGVSYYPNWHGDIAELTAGLEFLAVEAQQKVWIVETAYPWTRYTFGNDVINPRSAKLPGFQLSPIGQSAFITALQKQMRELPNNRGIGIAWWEGLSPNAYGRGFEYKLGMQNSTLVNAKAKALIGLYVLGKGK